MQWILQMKAVLRDHYDPALDASIIGFLRGSGSAVAWRTMSQAGSGQMIILGNRPPTNDDWVAAGVAQRIGNVTVTDEMLSGFMILYGGFMYRPWGHIVVPNNDVRTIGFPGSLRQWKNNYMPPRNP
jgi:hypothetical protein